MSQSDSIVPRRDQKQDKNDYGNHREHHVLQYRSCLWRTPQLPVPQFISIGYADRLRIGKVFGELASTLVL